MGLKIMEYRARMLGGTINFEEPGPGTRIVLSAPLHLLRQSKDKLRRAVGGCSGLVGGRSPTSSVPYFRITGTSV